VTSPAVTATLTLFVLRHGEAEFHLGSDASRPLTLRGMAETRAILTASLAELRQVTAIYASPLRRAQQTAAIAAELLGLPVHTLELLSPDGNPQEVMALCEQQTQQTLLLVSHQPLVGHLLDTLAGLEPGRQLMGTSALACLAADVLAPGCADLRWLRQPGTC
jgi:phosphohistidine phosphatase SixA